MTPVKKHILFICLALLACLAGCQEENPPVTDRGQEDPAPVMVNNAPEPSEVSAETAPVDRQPPRPPLKEDFQGDPKLPLFPRVGEFQPPPGDPRHPDWRREIDQLVKFTGVAEDAADGSRGWVFRSIKSVDSLGYFSPVAVEPGKIYQVTFKLTADLPEGASAGMAILEFDEFLWIAEQYTEETYSRHYLGGYEGRRMNGKGHGMQSFVFTAGPKTRMVHLVLFRDGSHDLNSLMFDDIEIR